MKPTRPSCPAAAPGLLLALLTLLPGLAQAQAETAEPSREDVQFQREDPAAAASAAGMAGMAGMKSTDDPVPAAGEAGDVMREPGIRVVNGGIQLPQALLELQPPSP